MDDDERERESDSGKGDSRAEKTEDEQLWGGVEGLRGRNGGKKRKTLSYHSGKQERGVVMGSPGVGQRRVFSGRPVSVPRGRERRKMGKGLEGEGEKLFLGA